MVVGAMPKREAVTRSMTERDTASTSRLLIGRDIFQFRQLLQPADETVGPVVQFVRIGVFERVLVLRAAHPIVHSNVLHRLHEQLYALNLVQL